MATFKWKCPLCDKLITAERDEWGFEQEISYHVSRLHVEMLYQRAKELRAQGMAQKDAFSTARREVVKEGYKGV